MHHDTKSNSSYVSTYLVINPFLILILIIFDTMWPYTDYVNQLKQKGETNFLKWTKINNLIVLKSCLKCSV